VGDYLTTPDPVRCALFLAGVATLWVVSGTLAEYGFGREGDIRKVNHVAAFAGGALAFGWLPAGEARASFYAVCPALLVLVVLACRFRSRVPFRQAFAANTRESDGPLRGVYFWSSWLVSALALLAIDLLFGSVAVVRTAALVVGLADGVGEPVGRRWGGHRYRVRSPWGEPATRSVEGSAAVFVAAAAVTLSCNRAAPGGDAHHAAAALGVAAAVTAVEAVSPRGSDNFTIALTAAGLTWAVFGGG
jgi:phytol kinase